MEVDQETISKVATALVRAKPHFKPIDVSLSDKSAHVIADVSKFGAILIKYRCFSLCSILGISGVSEDVDLTPVVTPIDRQLEIKSLISELRLTGSDVNGIMQSWFPGKGKISLLSDQEFDLLKLKLHETANLRQERMLAIH